MKETLKSILASLPGGVTLIETLRGQSLQMLFARYYETNNWGDGESVSGSHSTVRYTESLRTQLPELLRTLWREANPRRPLRRLQLVSARTQNRGLDVHRRRYCRCAGRAQSEGVR